MDNGTCNKGEQTGGRDGDNAVTDTDTIAVSVREDDEEDKGIIDGDSLDRLSLIVLSWLSS